MNKDKKILIVGAGPSGLSMALFLAEKGYNPKIIDAKKEISPHSKALAVNPRTLEILEQYNISKRFLDAGRKMQAMNIWRGDNLTYTLDLTKVDHTYPFMLVLPQKKSEKILLDELNKRHIEVEYSTEYTLFERYNGKYNVFTENRSSPMGQFDLLIGADGGSSRVRNHLGIALKGYKYDDKWELYDIELETSLSPDQGHIRLFDEGGMIMIRLHKNIWRVAGNMVSILNYIPKGAQLGPIHWGSNFRIHHQVAKSLISNNALIIGDAAHLHSPAGARGMNLGIEDAYLASNLIAENKIDNYDLERRPYLEKTVNRINNMTLMMAGNSTFSKMFRKNMGVLKFILPLVAPSIRKVVMGLDD